MNEFAADLTRRESEIAELFAWGASKKDVAGRLSISERTVENHARNIYGKTGCTKVNELSAWWFCTKFSIPFDLSPLKRTAVSVCLLAVMAPQILRPDIDSAFVRTARTETRAARCVRRRNEDGPAIDFMN